MTLYKENNSPGVKVTKMKLIKNLGIEGDIHQGGSRQVSLITAEARQNMNNSNITGLCFSRYSENITLDGMLLNSLKPGEILKIGEAEIRISDFRKPCFDECRLFSKNTPCPISGCAIFATVIKSGLIRINDLVIRS